MRPNLAQQKLDRIGMLPSRYLVSISGLGEDVVVRRRNTGAHGNLSAAHRAKIAVKQPGAQLRIAELRRHTQNVQLRAA